MIIAAAGIPGDLAALWARRLRHRLSIDEADHHDRTYSLEQGIGMRRISACRCM